MVYGLMGFPHKYLEKGIGDNHVNVSLLKWDMYHRIRAFGQEADDTRTVNHLKRLQTEKATLPSFTPFRDLSVAIYLPRYGHQNSESLADQSWLEVRDTCCVLGWGGPGLGVEGVGAVRLLGVQSPSPSSEQLPAGQTCPLQMVEMLKEVNVVFCSPNSWLISPPKHHHRVKSIFGGSLKYNDWLRLSWYSEIQIHVC